jgi:hypothetical protein
MTSPGLNDQVFFTLADGLQFGRVQERNPQAQLALGRDGLVTQIETQFGGIR